MEKGIEDLEVYDLQGNFLGRQRRDLFYKEIREEFSKTGRITKKVKTIKLILMNSDGRIYVQKRSKTKKENPGLYDKTVGGHVRAGHSFYLTVIQECH